MPFNYVSMSANDQWLSVAQNLHSREVEWFHYDLNVQNYTALLASESMAGLPAEWPEELVKYKNLSRDEAIRKIEDIDTLLLVQNLAHRDRIKLLMRAEIIERQKVGMYRDQLLASFPSAQVREAALTRAQEIRDAQAANPPQ